MNVAGSLFSGVGLLDYGLHLAGWRHAFFCESDEWRRGILRKRWPGVPVHPDVRELRGDAVQRPTLLAGGFPCKGASTAGKRTGLDHPETALWAEFARLIGELRPRYVLVENVRNILALHDGAVWGTVLGDLAALGFDAWWDCVPAGAFGAPHRRDRVFCVAHDPDWARLEDGSGLAGQSAGQAARPLADAPDLRHERARGSRNGRSGSADGFAPAPDPTRDGGQGTRAERATLGRAATDDREPFPWGQYAPAVERWEAVHGPAPEPLVRGVDARSSARVVRSRLSALGDGVQVQAGHLLGRMILEHAQSQEAA